MRNKFFDVKCPSCFKSLRANNVVFKYSKKAIPIDPAFLKREDLIIEKGYLKSIKYDGEPLTDRCCPYCLKKLPNEFGVAETKYISLICLNETHEKYTEAAKRQLENRLGWKSFEETENYFFFKHKERKKDYHVSIYKSDNNNLLNSDSERSKIYNADGIIFIIDSVSNGYFVEILNKLSEKERTVPVAFIFNDFDRLHQETFNYRTDKALEPIITYSEIDANGISILSDRLKTILIDSRDEDKLVFKKAETILGENNKVFHLMTNKIEGAETPLLWLLSELGVFTVK